MTMTLGTQTASLVNHLMSGTRGAPMPVAGMGATLLCWTDRHAYTILDASNKTLIASRDKATRTDSNGMSESQAWTFERDPNATPEVFTLRKNGSWVKRGDSMSGFRLRIGERAEYYDHSF